MYATFAKRKPEKKLFFFFLRPFLIVVLNEFSFFSILVYAKIKKELSYTRKVFFEEVEVCNRGTARYLLDLAQTDKYTHRCCVCFTRNVQREDLWQVHRQLGNGLCTDIICGLSTRIKNIYIYYKVLNS